jgi:hypothetical protein
MTIFLLSGRLEGLRLKEKTRNAMWIFLYHLSNARLGPQLRHRVFVRVFLLCEFASPPFFDLSSNGYQPAYHIIRVIEHQKKVARKSQVIRLVEAKAR